MDRQKGSTKRKKSNGAKLGFEEKLWKAADKLRNNMDAAEYKHVVLGLIFLKYISDSFEDLRAKLISEQDKGASEYFSRRESFLQKDYPDYQNKNQVGLASKGSDSRGKYFQ